MIATAIIAACLIVIMAWLKYDWEQTMDRKPTRGKILVRCVGCKAARYVAAGQRTFCQECGNVEIAVPPKTETTK